MEALNSIILEIPLIQVIILLSLSTLFLLFRRDRLALLTNYIFILYWGYIFNQDTLFSLSESDMNCFLAAYFGFGIIVAFLAIYSFMSSEGVAMAK